MPSLKSSGLTMRLSEDTCPTIQNYFISLSLIEFSAFGSTLNHISGEDWLQRKILQARPLEGYSAQELANSHRWWSGPDFLWKPFDYQTNVDKAAIGFVAWNNCLETGLISADFPIKIK